MVRSRWMYVILPMIFFAMLAGCSTTPRPRDVTNLCEIFQQYPKWYWATQDTQRKWGVPIAVQMAFIFQESRFTAKAKPPRTRLLWIIPWRRPSSSFGYTQALKPTWNRYKRASGGRWASRSSFSKASDFIGWYANYAHNKLGIPLDNARLLYLAYHEGTGGFKQGTYRDKPWLMAVARKVQRRAWTYNWQLSRCRSYLKQKPWYHIW